MASHWNERGRQLKRPLLWRLKSGRRKPVVDAQGGLGLSSLAQKHLTLMVAWREFFSFRPEAFDLLVQTIWERQNVFEPATLHDTTSLLTGPNRRVCKSDTNMRMTGRRFQSEHKVTARTPREQTARRLHATARHFALCSACRCQNTVASIANRKCKSQCYQGDGWCCQTGLNCRPLHYQWSALPLSYGSMPGIRGIGPKGLH
jgi:hypothetical protein